MNRLRIFCIIATFVNLPALILWTVSLKISLDEYRNAGCLDKCSIASSGVLMELWYIFSSAFFEVIFIAGWCLL